jgi:predicted HicB family RNase H-like nuclease
MKKTSKSETTATTAPARKTITATLEPDVLKWAVPLAAQMGMTIEELAAKSLADLLEPTDPLTTRLAVDVDAGLLKRMTRQAERQGVSVSRFIDNMVREKLFTMLHPA